MAEASRRVTDLPAVYAGLLAAAVGGLFCPVIDFLWTALIGGEAPKWAEGTLPHILGAAILLGLIVAGSWWGSYRQQNRALKHRDASIKILDDTIQMNDLMSVKRLRCGALSILSIMQLIEAVDASGPFIQCYLYNECSESSIWNAVILITLIGSFVMCAIIWFFVKNVKLTKNNYGRVAYKAEFVSFIIVYVINVIVIICITLHFIYAAELIYDEYKENIAIKNQNHIINRLNEETDSYNIDVSSFNAKAEVLNSLNLDKKYLNGDRILSGDFTRKEKYDIKPIS